MLLRAKLDVNMVTYKLPAHGHSMWLLKSIWKTLSLLAEVVVPLSLYTLYWRSQSVTDVLGAMRCSLVQGMKTVKSFWLKTEYYFFQKDRIEGQGHPYGLMLKTYLLPWISLVCYINHCCCKQDVRSDAKEIPAHRAKAVKIAARCAVGATGVFA